MKEKTKYALIDVIKALKGYAYHQGNKNSGVLQEDIDSSDHYTNKMIEKLIVALEKE